MKQSMKFAEGIAVDSIAISIATPYPGTALYQLCKAKGYLVEEFKYEKLTTRVCQIRTPEFTPDEVETILNKTLVRRALRHPIGTFRRLFDKFRGSPLTTLSFVFKRLVSVVFNRT